MKVGLIGYGSIGSRHYGNLFDQGANPLVYETDPACDLQTKVGWDALVRDSDGFIICSPTDTHADYIEKLLPTGKPILVEKPIAHDRNAFLRLKEKELKRVYVGNNLRFHESIQHARKLILEGLIGHPQWATFCVSQYSEKPVYLRDGVILNWGAHEIDLALHLLGPAFVRGASARTDFGAEDIADVLLVHESGCLSTVHMDYVTSPEVRQTMIVGNAGAIIMDIANRHLWLRDPGGHTDLYEAIDDWDQNYADELDEFLDVIRGNRPANLATAKEGLDTLDIILKAKLSAKVKQ